MSDWFDMQVAPEQLAESSRVEQEADQVLYARTQNHTFDNGVMFGNASHPCTECGNTRVKMVTHRRHLRDDDPDSFEHFVYRDYCAGCGLMIKEFFSRLCWMEVGYEEVFVRDGEVHNPPLYPPAHCGLMRNHPGPCVP